MNTVVFVGPSLAGEVYVNLENLTFRPPAQQGDLIGAAYEGAERIVLIDGYFGQHLSVWHKEILEALNRGVSVIGAASMGALRALECEAYGMQGHGRVFAMYKRGLIANDDEVALSHAGEEHGWRNLSLPLVNVRMTLARMVAEKVITSGGAEETMEHAAAVFYADRTWTSFSGRRDADRMKEFYVDVKRADALDVLEEIARGAIMDVLPDRRPNLTRHGGLLDEDRVVTVSHDRARVRNLGFPPLLDEVGFLRAAALRLAVECGIPRAAFDDEGQQAVEDERALADLREWMSATGYRSEASRQRIFAAGKAKRAST